MNISRFAFFTSLLTLITPKLKAQTTITPCQPRLQWGDTIPNCNGQCPNPTCTYMAPPWKSGLGHDETQPKNVFYANTPNDWTQTPSVRIVRCPKCSTAFWQDPIQ